MKTSSLSEVINIGKDTETKLIRAGIDSYDKLVKTGTEKAFLRLQAFDPGACLTLLYSLEGAITGTKWNKLPDEKKKELLHFHKMSKKNLK